MGMVRGLDVQLFVLTHCSTETLEGPVGILRHRGVADELELLRYLVNADDHGEPPCATDYERLCVSLFELIEHLRDSCHYVVFWHILRHVDVIRNVC